MASKDIVSPAKVGPPYPLGVDSLNRMKAPALAFQLSPENGETPG
jgi:hypothetical protein